MCVGRTTLACAGRKTVVCVGRTTLVFTLLCNTEAIDWLVRLFSANEKG